MGRSGAPVQHRLMTVRSRQDAVAARSKPRPYRHAAAARREQDGVVGSAFGEGVSDADRGDCFGGILGLGSFCCGGEDVGEFVACGWDGDDCVCRGVVFGGGGEYVFWGGARGVWVLGGAADIFRDFFGAVDWGGGGAEVVALASVGSFLQRLKPLFRRLVT